MVRKGVLAFLVVGLVACTQDVDDPANFTAGNTQGNTQGSSSSGTPPDGQTSVDDNGNGQTSTTGTADETGTPATTGPSTTGNTGNCGNGVIDAGEQCDGSDLQGFDCASLGLNGGTLSCDPMMCTFDTSMCSSTTGTSG